MFRVLLFLLSILPCKVFELGEGRVTRYTQFECKWLFSIYFHRIETLVQDRLHTHAFNAFVYIISGGYSEIVKERDGKIHVDTYHNGQFRYIPRLLNHKLMCALPETLSLLITGPYQEMWTEELDDGTLRVITTGQKLLYELSLKESPQRI